MKRLIFAILILLATTAHSAELTAEWTPQTTIQIDGTRIYQDTSSAGPVAEVSGNQLNKANFPMPEDGLCHNYWATNFIGSVESAKSEVIAWCPPNDDPPPAIQPPSIIGGFKITVEPL